MDLYSNGLMVSRKLLEKTQKPWPVWCARSTAPRWMSPRTRTAAVEAIIAFDNLVDPELERARLEFALTNLMNAPEAADIGMGDLVDERLTRSIGIVAEGYGLERLPEASEIFDRSFLPPTDARTFEVMIN